MSVYDSDGSRPTLGFMFGLPGEPLLRPPATSALPDAPRDPGTLGVALPPAWPPVDPAGLSLVPAPREVEPEPAPDDEPYPPAAESPELRVVDLRTTTIDQAAARLISAEVARFYTALPYAFEDGVPLVALADESETAMQSLRLAIGREARFARAGRLDLVASIAGAYADPGPPSQATTAGFRVVVRLANDETVDVDRFDGVPEARTRALELVEQLSQADDCWPFIRGRFLRPDAVVSVDIVERPAT